MNEHHGNDGCLDEIVQVSEESGLYEEPLSLSEYMDLLAPEDGVPGHTFKDAQVVEFKEES